MRYCNYYNYIARLLKRAINKKSNNTYLWNIYLWNLIPKKRKPEDLLVCITVRGLKQMWIFVDLHLHLTRSVLPRGINDHDFSDNRLNIGQTGVSRTIGDPLKIKSSQQRAGEIKDCLKSLNDETVRKWNRTFTRIFLVYTIAVASTHGNDSFVYKYTRNYFTKPFQKK